MAKTQLTLLDSDLHDLTVLCETRTYMFFSGKRGTFNFKYESRASAHLANTRA